MNNEQKNRWIERIKHDWWIYEWMNKCINEWIGELN